MSSFGHRKRENKRSSELIRYRQIFISSRQFVVKWRVKIATKRNPGNAGRCTKANAKKIYSKKRRYHGKNKKKIQLPDLEEALVVDVHNVDIVVQEEGNDVYVTSAPPVPPSDPLPPVPTVSETKIIDIDVDEAAETPSLSLISGYRLMDMSILADVFASLSCPGCHDTKTLKLRNIFEKKRGLARYLHSSTHPNMSNERKGEKVETCTKLMFGLCMDVAKLILVTSN